MVKLILGSASIALAAATLVAQARQAGMPTAATAERIDYLTFAQGGMPVSIGGAGAKLGANFESAVRIADGDPTAFTIASRATADTDTEFVYQLPALTTFDRFAVPNIVETPSPTATFTRVVEVHGSAKSATDGFQLLASATLQTHRTRGLVTELPVAARHDSSTRIVIEGHTSSEGTEDYNEGLSQRRAQAVVADLVRRGLSSQRLSAARIGERRPIATNNDESGRSLNRRVEVKCQ